MPAEVQAPHERVARLVESAGQPLAAVLGQDPDVRAVEPVPVGVVAAEPVVIDRVD